MARALRPPLALLLLLAFALPSALFAARPSGRAQLNAYFQSTLTDRGYQKKVLDRVLARFRQPKQLPKPGNKAVVQAVLDREGRLVSTTVSYSSGEPAWDAAAESAVKQAAPFPKLPDSYTFPTVEAHFHVTWAR